MTTSGTDYGFKRGKADLRSVGPIAFGPDDVLFVADTLGAAIFAIDVADPALGAGEPIEVEDLEGRLAAFLGCKREDVVVRDMEVHPRSENVYLSVSRGRGRDALPLIVRMHRSGALEDVDLSDVAFARFSIEDAPGEDQKIFGRSMRAATVLDMRYVDGVLLVAGMTNEEFSSSLRRIPVPFTGDVISNSLEIFHVSHGRYETAAPIRTFMPYTGRGASILASYTCTPLVTFELSELGAGQQARGTTVAELGARNAPIDMLTFEQRGQEFVLISNTHHPLMKISTREIDQQAPLLTPRAPVGASFVPLPQRGITRLANLNGSHVLMLQREGDTGPSHLRSVATDAL
jgi:hypothetical protein